MNEDCELHLVTPIKEQLEAIARGGVFGHAFILSGDDAYAAAIFLAQCNNCLTPIDGLACGDCQACRKIAAGVFEELHIIYPEKNLHRIEKMRSVQEMAARKAIYGRVKVFIIVNAELMQEAAANSLLKILEEPPDNTLFILLADNIDRILPTIISRCQVFGCGRESVAIIDDNEVEKLIPQAQELLLSLPQLQCWQVLLKAKTVIGENDKQQQLNYFTALLWLLVSSIRGERQLPFKPEQALKSAMMMENAIDYIYRNINRKILTDVIFLRLWQNAMH